ncbi:MAG: hypothetical protein DRN06_03230 [Thermoprotei archaeon]|nr:MAG: hypothetical protein DRN06_03230 [Thermoprotei archaeon]
MKLARRILREGPVQDISSVLGIEDEVVIAIREAVLDMQSIFSIKRYRGDDVDVKTLRKARGKSESWYIRAVTRMFFVKQVRELAWRVKGLPELGDEYDEYLVTFSKDRNRYVCSCYSHGKPEWRKAREKKICTHIAAVILYRRVLKRINMMLPQFF